MQTMQNTLEYWALKQADKPAVIGEDVVLTWREFNQHADAAAQRLSDLGISAGDVVALRLQTTPQWAVLMAALSKLNARLLGVNWRLLPEEVDFLLEDAQAKLLVFDDEESQALTSHLKALDPSRMKMADHIDPPGLSSQPAIARQTKSGMCEQIIYTSGTTGKPKGILLEKRDATSDERLSRYQADLSTGHRHYGPSDVVLVSMPLHHGSGSAQVKMGLTKGATVILQKRFDPAQWFDWVERYGVTHWTGVPTMYKRLKTYLEQSRRAVPSIKHMGIGAAPVPMAIKHWIQEQFGSVLHESYGCTETGLIARMMTEDHFRKAGSSGLPHDGVEIEIRREDGGLCAPNEEGEIWASTPVTITGYLNAPPLGHDTLDARGFFRVGDVGRLDDDGYLYITDRAKDMIISGGVNIYPAEIEAVFYRHPDVHDIAVIGLPDEEYGERVVAYYESKSGTPIEQAELSDIARSSLASYKRPKEFVHVDELPRNAVGKVLKRELRQPHWAQQERNV